MRLYPWKRGGDGAIIGIQGANAAGEAVYLREISTVPNGLLHIKLGKSNAPGGSPAHVFECELKRAVPTGIYGQPVGKSDEETYATPEQALLLEKFIYRAGRRGGLDIAGYPAVENMPAAERCKRVICLVGPSFYGTTALLRALLGVPIPSEQDWSFKDALSAGFKPYVPTGIREIAKTRPWLIGGRFGCAPQTLYTGRSQGMIESGIFVAWPWLDGHAHERDWSYFLRHTLPERHVITESLTLNWAISKSEFARDALAIMLPDVGYEELLRRATLRKRDEKRRATPEETAARSHRDGPKWRERLRVSGVDLHELTSVTLEDQVREVLSVL